MLNMPHYTKYFTKILDELQRSNYIGNIYSWLNIKLLKAICSTFPAISTKFYDDNV